MSLGQIFSVLQRDSTNTGYNISVAFDGKNSLGLIRKLKTDLILLDVMMPGLDGFEVCKRLKGNPEVSDIPFIFITTMGMPKDVLTGFKSGERSITSLNLSNFKRCVSE
jgi:CheY-like chemotaxis protein